MPGGSQRRETHIANSSGVKEQSLMHGVRQCAVLALGDLLQDSNWIKNYFELVAKVQVG